MKEEKKLSKKIAGFIIGGILVFVLILTSTPAWAELNLGLVGGYYSPSFGKINDYFDEEYNDVYGTDFGFEAGMMYGLVLGYDVNPHFRLRLEYNSFESKTSDSYPDPRPYEWVDWDTDWKLTVTPVILSGIYKFSFFYIGAGLGLFSTEVKEVATADSYYESASVSDSHARSVPCDIHPGDTFSRSVSDSPIGILVLGGFELGGKSPFLSLEARYVVGTKAKLEDLDTEVDLSGLQFSLVAGFKF